MSTQISPNQSSSTGSHGDITEIIPGVKQPAKSGYKFDQRWIAPLFVSSVVLAAQLAGGVVESWRFFAAAVITSILFEVVLGKLVYGKPPHFASAWVSGISVGILIHTNVAWPYALCAALSITSKYVLRVNGKHIWNPSNFGICAMLLLAHDFIATLSVQFGNDIRPNIVIWILGSVIVSRLKRLHITVTYVASFFAFAALRSVIVHQDFWTVAGPITGPMYQLFIFFMITDPKTTVTSKKGQILVAFLVAAMEGVFRLAQNVHAPYFALFTVGPIANLVEMYLFKPKSPITSGPGPLPVPA